MDFNFSEEQDALRSAVRATLEQQVAPHLLALGDSEDGIPEGFWPTIASLGWTGLLIPEEHGGLGMSLVDMVVLQEEMGRLPAPGPFFSSACFATIAALRLGATDLLAGLASGRSRGTVAIEEISSRDPLDGIGVRATGSGDDWMLTGVKPVVLDGHSADWVIVAARTDAGLEAFLLTDFVAQPSKALDPTRKMARIELSETPARRLTDGDASAALRRIAEDAAVLLCAELTGLSEKALELATVYASQREQFGRPIGKFQAIKHMAAETLQDVELCRVAAHYAAWCSANETADREQATAMAKGWCGEAAIRVTQNALQIHGAVGFTWECPVHLHYKRAKTNDLLLGQQGWQRARVADLILGPVSSTPA